MERHLNTEQLRQFETHLLCEERSAATVEKYLHDLRVFYAFMDGKELNKTAVLEYKSNLLNKYAVTSANSMLAAVNAFFRFLGFYAHIIPVSRAFVNRKLCGICKHFREYFAQIAQISLAVVRSRRAGMD